MGKNSFPIPKRFSKKLLIVSPHGPESSKKLKITISPKQRIIKLIIILLTTGFKSSLGFNKLLLKLDFSKPLFFLFFLAILFILSRKTQNTTTLLNKLNTKQEDWFLPINYKLFS